MTPELVIIGAGSHASVLVDMIEQRDDVLLVGFVDDYKEDDHDGYGIMGKTECLSELVHLHIFYFLVAIGNNRVRRHLYEQAVKAGLVPYTLIHPSAQISPKARIGDGTVIMANVAVNAYAFVGDNAILNTGCTVDHHCVVGDHAHIAPGVHLAGNVWVKDTALAGIGSAVKPNGIVDTHGRIFDSTR